MLSWAEEFKACLGRQYYSGRSGEGAGKQEGRAVARQILHLSAGEA
jgi:hypothetical protein